MNCSISEFSPDSSNFNNTGILYFSDILSAASAYSFPQFIFPLDDTLNNLSLFFALKNFVEPAINNAGLELLEKWFVIETEFGEKNGYAIQLTLINE